MKTVFLFSVILWSLSSAAESPISFNKEGNCRMDLEDPYSPDARMPGNGPYAGQCLDTRGVRAIQILDSQLLNKFQTAARPGSIIVANFKHNHQFWIAEIPTSEIKEVFMQQEVGKENIPIHHQARFVFNEGKGIRLFPQKKSQEAQFKEPVLVKDFVVTAIGLRPAELAGTPFSPLKGLKKSYGQGIGFASMDDTWKYDTLPLEHDLLQFRLKMTDKQKEKLVKFYIKRSDKVRESLEYHSVYENCVSELFQGFAKVAKVQKPFSGKWTNAKGDTQYVPWNTLEKLKLYNLIDDEYGSRISNISVEYKDRQATK
ncbi:MAG: DUF4105 domain-containing protein [Pseudobdellovibrionaceae bacterium]